MTTYKFFPKWCLNLGSLHASKAYVRSQCDCCGLQHRVDLTTKIMIYGPGASLIDRRERCDVVGCSGTLFFLCAPGIGKDFMPMLRDSALLDNAAAAVNACMVMRENGKAKRA